MTEIGPNSLTELLAGGIFSLFLILARVGGALAYMPGFGDMYVTPQVRFILSVTISFVLMPLIAPQMPAIPPLISDWVLLFGSELLYGMFIGVLARLMLLALDLAGYMIATNAGLSAATSFNPQMSSSGPILTSLLSMTAILLIFLTNLHHMLLGALVDSYNVFKVGDTLLTKDLANTIVNVVGHAFALGFQLSAPFVVVGLVFNVALGLAARLVPQMHVFMIGVPIQILGGLLLMSLMILSITRLWLTEFEKIYLSLFG